MLALGASKLLGKISGGRNMPAAAFTEFIIIAAYEKLSVKQAQVISSFK